MPPSRSRSVWYGALAALILAVDIVTKRLAVANLLPGVPSHEIFGGLARLTLGFNTGAAFGMTVGIASRAVFTLLALAILVVLWRLYRETPESNALRAFALTCVMAGATGNLIDRLRWSRGVVDFIDVGLGAHRFWIFNVADSAVSIGAVLLAWELLRERSAAEAAGMTASAPAAPSTLVDAPIDAGAEAPPRPDEA